MGRSAQSSDFHYEEPHRDSLVGNVCSNQYEATDLLSDVRRQFQGQTYFFEPEVIDAIIALEAWFQIRHDHRERRQQISDQATTADAIRQN